MSDTCVRNLQLSMTTTLNSCSGCHSSKQRLISNINCVIITGLEVYVRELLKFGIDKQVVNDSLSVCFCVLI